MDRASASEAGNVGSTPAERKFKTPAWCGVFNFMREHTPCGVCVREAKAGALCEFEFSHSENERRAWRGGAASAARQQGDLWPTTETERKILRYRLN